MLAAECWTCNSLGADAVESLAAGMPEESTLLDAGMRLTGCLLALLVATEGCAVFQAASAHQAMLSRQASVQESSNAASLIARSGLHVHVVLVIPGQIWLNLIGDPRLTTVILIAYSLPANH